MAREHPHTMTGEEYFHLEENDHDTRYDYLDGQVYATVGGTANHDTITSKKESFSRELVVGVKSPSLSVV